MERCKFYDPLSGSCLRRVMLIIELEKLSDLAMSGSDINPQEFDSLKSRVFDKPSLAEERPNYSDPTDRFFCQASLKPSAEEIFAEQKTCDIYET